MIRVPGALFLPWRFPKRVLAALLPVAALLALSAVSASAQPFAFTLSPSFQTAGFPTFTLTVGGSNFANGDTVFWTNAGVTTSLVTANPTLQGTQITATVPAGLIATGGSAAITVGTTPGNASSPALTFNIFKNSISTATLATNPLTANVGQGVTLTATYIPSPGGVVTPTGTVTFSDTTTGTTLGTASLTSSGGNGVATLTTSAALPLGSHTLVTSWPGDATFNLFDGSPTAFLSVINVTLGVPSPNSLAMAVNASVTYTATVDLGGATGAVGPLTIQDGGVAITNGNGTCAQAGNPVSPIAGTTAFTMTCTVVYDGTGVGADADRAEGIHSMTVAYNNAALGVVVSTAQTVTVTAATPLISTPVSSTPGLVSGQPTNLTVVVAGIPPRSTFNTLTGSVNFFDNGSATPLNATPIALTPIANNQGTASLTQGFLAGAHSITARYTGSAAGNPVYNAVTSQALSLQVGQANTTTTLSAANSSPVFGIADVLTAAVSVVSPGLGTPTGTVSFRNNGLQFGTGTLNGAGTATYTLTTALAPGVYANITAVYLGDTNNLTSTSPAIPITVNRNSTTGTLTASPVGPSPWGTFETLTATFIPANGGAGTPSGGTVTFIDVTADVQLGTATLNAAGVATFFTSTLTPGTHTLSAGYSGDTNFNGLGVAPTRNLTINFVSPSVTVTPNPASVTVGKGAASTVTFAVTVVGGPFPPIGTITMVDGGRSVGAGPGTCPGGFTLTQTDSANTSIGSCTIVYDGSNVDRIVGIHPMVAHYVPSGASTVGLNTTDSAARPVIVNRANTTTTLSVASSNFTFGSANLLTATVTANSPGAGAPTGTVSFLNGYQTFGTGTLVGGVATYVLTTALPPNSYSITAVYNGDANNSSSASTPFTVTVAPASTFEISNAAVLPPGTVGVPYLAGFGSSGGNGNVSWMLTGGVLPDGLSMSSAGILKGTPTLAGNYSFSVTATDSSGNTANTTFSLLINPAPLVVTGDLPAGPFTVGASFSLTFGASGGVKPYTFGNSGTLPAGTSVIGNTISGTLTGAGAFAFTISATDHVGTVANKNFSVTVTAPLTLTGSLPDGQVGVVYSGKVGASGGTLPYTFTGTAPPGLTVGSDGSVTGTPTANGPFTVNITVTDKTGGTATLGFNITIIPAPLTITTLSLPDGAVNSPYTAGVTAAGGVKPYTFSIGGLPDGVKGGTDGSITGTPTAAGPFTVTATVKDAAGKTANASFNITIVPAPLVLTLSAGNGTVGTAYSANASATGGVKPYTFSASGLPAGVTIDSGSGAISGTPTAGGTTTISVTVTDHAGKTATQTAQVTITLPPAPPVGFTGVSSTGTPGGQQTVGITIANPYPVDMSVVLTLTFAPDAGGDDLTIMFSTGGRTAHLTVPAGATVSLTTVGVQTGTVAGLITITAQLSVSNADITPSPAPKTTIRINAAAPVISTAAATRNASGFTVVLTGFVTDREITQVIFTFNAAPGATLQTTSVTIPVDTLFSAWFSSSAANAFGSQFSFTQPFTVQGNASSIVSVTITMVNKVGSSTAVTVNLQ